MDWKLLASKLFPQGHSITEKNDFLEGSALIKGETVSVIGTTNHASIGIDLALKQSRAVLKTIHAFPKQSIVILVDTNGQRLRLQEEMLGLNASMAHLGKCLDLARRRGHKIIGLVYDQALSGGFITSGLLADSCYALKSASIAVMGLAAMARITKIPEETLAALAKINPVFAHGPDNYFQMGAIDAVFDQDLDHLIADALKNLKEEEDSRSLKGKLRGGRKLAYNIAEMVMKEP